ncbi:MAG: RHS repeat-associated core domain-containing protein, partial [Bacteroidota bacterium]
FGLRMQDRQFEWQFDNYRFGFNGKERDKDEEWGAQTHYDYGARIYNPAIGRWLSVDPLAGHHDQVGRSPYGYAWNNPVLLTDPDGKCPDCKDGTYTIKKGDIFYNLEKKWGMESGTLQGYNPELDANSLSIGQIIKVSPTSSGNFKSGTGNPTITHDAGFSGFPREDPTTKDYASYTFWKTKAAGARALRWDLDDALDAYEHYLDATGTDAEFSLEEFFTEDDSGKSMKENSIEAAKLASQTLLPYAGTRELSMSSPFYVGSGGVDFPYPETENWQKAVGAFPFYMTGTVTAHDVGDQINYRLRLTIHAEDMYNFNPGAADIETGTPDSVNGRFEVVGLAKQFLNKGSFSTTVNWSIPKK